MKKKFFIIASIAIVMVVAGLNIKNNKQDTLLSSLTLSNVEALANNESGGGSGCSFYCCYSDYNSVLKYASSICNSFSIMTNPEC